MQLSPQYRLMATYITAENTVSQLAHKLQTISLPLLCAGQSMSHWLIKWAAQTDCHSD